MFRLDKFVSESVICRPESMFEGDISAHKEELLKKIKNRSVLVIGGAGSIGSSFIKAVLPYGPAELVVVDTNENALTELTRDLRSRGLHIPDRYTTYPMDYASSVFKKLFLGHKGYDIVANFAAHKHVRSEKDTLSVEALFRNNVMNAKGLLELLSEYPPEHFFCVSTDKAANPVNLMGASKRIMEDLAFSYSDRFPVSTARFANVAFSNGSLLDGFLRRMEKLQPLSAPSDVRRFFVSLEESGQICMLACLMGNSREIFFPKLEENQMKSFDVIAREFLTAHGYEAEECGSDEEAILKAENLKRGSRHYPVHFSRSDTSGEKQYEEFFTERETADMDRFTALGVITGKNPPEKDALNGLLSSLENRFSDLHTRKQDIVETISGYLPEFRHLETGKSLDQKM